MAEENLKSKTKKGLYWKFTDLVTGMGMQFAVGIFMARMLSPSDYGITALPAIFMVIAGLFASAGFGQALVRKPDLTEEDLATSFYYSTGIGIIIYIIFFLLSPFIADFYNTPVLTPLIRVTSLGFIYGPLSTPQNIILQRRLDFKTPTKVGIVTRIVSAVIGISMAYNGYGVWALTISSMIAGIVSLLFNWYIVRWYPKTGWSKDSFKYLWGFGNKYMASRIIDTLYNNITPVFIGKYYSTSDLGVYNRADGYANLPSVTMTNVIQNVTYPVLSKVQNDEEKLVAHYRRMIRTSSFIIFPMMMMLAALARPLIIVMITEKWADCIILLQIICFSRMWYHVHAMNLNLLMVKERTDLFLKLEIIKKCYGIVILLATLPFGLVVFTSGMIFSSLISLYVNTYYSGKLVNFGLLKQLKDITPILLLSFLMFVIVYGITNIIPNMILQIIIGGSVGCLLYLGVAFFCKMPELADVKYMLNRKQ